MIDLLGERPPLLGALSPVLIPIRLEM